MLVRLQLKHKSSQILFVTIIRVVYQLSYSFSLIWLPAALVEIKRLSQIYWFNLFIFMFSEQFYSPTLAYSISLGGHNILWWCFGSFMIIRPSLSCSHWLKFVHTECCHDIILHMPVIWSMIKHHFFYFIWSKYLVLELTDHSKASESHLGPVLLFNSTVCAHNRRVDVWGGRDWHLFCKNIFIFMQLCYRYR